MEEGLGLTLRGRRERVAVGSGKDEGGGMHKSSGIADGTHSGSSGGGVNNTEAVGRKEAASFLSVSQCCHMLAG